MPFRFKLIFVALLTALIITVLGFPLAPFIQSETYFTFTGGGHGHGVGMSMAGVKKQAQAGRDYPTIMKYYYGSIRVGKKSLPRYIRAAVLSTTSKLSFSANKDFRVYDSRNRYLKTVKRSDVFKVSFKRGRYYLYVVRKSKTIWSARRNISIVIKPWRASYLRLNNNGRRFKGNFYARSTGGSSIWAINKVSLRTYLKGLGEEPESWPIKGLRTLAVAARTYAVGKINKKQKHYDILPQQQYYVGIRKAPRLASAVNSTKGVIATYGGRPILAAYSANSGGYVADFRTVWGGRGYPYLRARKDNWSKGTKNYRWGPVTFSRSRLQSILRKRGVNVGTIYTIRLGSRGSDRRPVRVKVIGSKGSRTLRAYSEFSARLGLKSSLIWVRKGSSKRLTINASTKRLRPGQPLLIYGGIAPKTKGTLTLRYKKGGRGWKTAKRVKVNGSKYKIKVRPNTANRYVFSAKLGSRRSRNMVILARGKRVKRSSGKGKASLSTKRISINASAKRIRPRQPILIYGKATFPDKTTLTLRYKKGRGGWRTLKTLSTKNQRYKTKVRLNSASRYVFALRKGKTASRNMIIYSRGKPVKVVRKKKKKKSRGRPLIVVDPGHGGRQAGAIGPGGLREKTINLKVGLKLRNYLKRAGARVVMTRTNDKTLSLKARVNIAKRVKANRFVSVHHNSTRNRRVNGTETYVKRGASKTSRDMARKVHRSLLRNLKLANRKMRSANFYVLRYNRIPAILTEASFISNRRQAKRLRRSSYLDKEARAIFYGLKSHMEFSRLYTPLAIQGTSAPAADIHFANVVDTNAYWRSIVSIKNTSAILQAVTLNFYDDNGTLLSSNNVDIAPNKVYSFYPKKILSAEFSGSIRATAAMPSLVGQLSQVSNNNKAIANVQALEGSTELHVPHIVDNSSWKSFVTLKNTTDSLGTATINLFNYDGTLAKTETVNIGPQAKYSFYPQMLVGQAFSGSVEINGSTPLVGYINRINVKQLRLGIAPAMIKNSEHYFAQAPENSAWRSYISIKNISSNTQTTTISAYKANGSVIKEKNIEIAPKAVSKIRVAEIVSSRFNGAIKISGQSNSLAAYLTQTDKKAKTLAILEGQQGLAVVDFAHVNDGGNPWNSEIAVSNTSGRANVNIGLHSGAGTVLSSNAHFLNKNGYYRFYPFETVNNSFIGSIKASTSNNQAVGYLAMSR